MSPAPPAGALTENLGALVIQNGRGIINITPGGGTSTNVLNLTTLNAIANNGALGGTLLLRGTGLGGTAGANVANLTFTTAPAVIGGGGGANSTTMSIRPDILGDTSLAGNGTGFVTYIAGTGFRLLAANELAANLGTQPVLSPFAVVSNPTNVSLTTLINLNTSTTNNSLTLAAGGGVFVTAGGQTSISNPGGSLFSAQGTLATFTVTSGGILSFTGNAGIKGGVLAPGANNQLIFHNLGNLAVNSYLNGGLQGLTKSSDGILTLNARSFVTGTATVNGGTLELSGGDNTLAVVSTATTGNFFDLRVNAGSVDLKGFSEAVGVLSNNNTANIGGVTTALPIRAAPSPTPALRP